VVLLPGSGGATPIDFVVRNEARIAAAGFETQVTTSTGTASSLASTAKQQGRKVVVVAMSLGATQAASMLASGTPMNGVVLVSGVGLDDMPGQLGSPSRLPPTLIVHHQRDACPRTTPDSASRFKQWGGGKVSLRWITNSGPPVPNPCGPRGAHGFFVQDGAAVSAIIGFIRSR
jgi:dienelactone hydrolase